MIRLNILSGGQAGGNWSARHFPVRIGRSASADLSLTDDGIWDEHLEIDLDRAQGFLLFPTSQGVVSVNGEPVCETRLRNGDVIGLGAVKLQFWLGEVGQRGLRFREALVWALISMVCISQIAVIYWLLD